MMATIMEKPGRIKKMKKVFLLTILPALLVLSSCGRANRAPAQEFFKEDTTLHEELFGQLSPRKLGVPGEANSDPSWTKAPKVGVQFKSYTKDKDDDGTPEDYLAVRFVAAIANTDGMTATWTRAVSEKDSNQIRPLSTGGGHVSAVKYDVLNDGGEKAASSEGSGYAKYVVYSMYDIPAAQSESYIAAYLTLTKAEEEPVVSKVIATQINGRNYFSFAADRSAGYFMEVLHGESKTIVEMNDTPSGTDVAKKEDLALNAGDEFEYFYYNPGTSFQCFGYSTFNRETYYFEKSTTSEYFKVRVDGTYTLNPNEYKLLYGTCSAADVTLYLKVNSNWSQDGAKFSVHYNDNDTFVALSQIGESDVYKLEHYNFKDHPSILFARHDTSGTYTWDTKWNQTSDIVYDGAGGNDNPAKSMYTLNDGWDYCGGSWSIYSAE